MESLTAVQPTLQPTLQPVIGPTDKNKEDQAKGNVAEPISENDSKGNVVSEPPKPIIAEPATAPAQK
jgi:hypothetical protein